jgi:hypothetical protein
MRILNLCIFGCISFLVVLIQGCVSLPTDVIMPQWDTNLNIPITSKNYTLDDIIKSQNYISINHSDNTYLITSDSLIQKTAISQFIQIKTERSSSSASVITDGSTTQQAFILFPEGAKISQASITQGQIKIISHNNYPTDALLTIYVPGILINGSPWQFTLPVPANTANITKILDLPVCQYNQPTGQAASQDGQLWIKATATSSSGLSYVSFEAYTSNFDFTSVTGYLPTKTLGTHSSSFPLNLGDASNYRNKVLLSKGSLSLTGKYQSSSFNPFIVGINNLRLVGKRNDSPLTNSLTFTDPNANSFRFDASGNYSTVYDETNSNITDFISFLPDSIYVSAEYIMNPDNNTNYKTVRSDDSISFTTRFTSKSILTIKQTTFQDTLDINMSKDDRDQIVNGKGAQLSVDLKNAIPLNTWIKVTITDNNYHPLKLNGSDFVITKNNNGTDSVNISGSLTNLDGSFLSASASKTSIDLDSLQIKLFAQNAYHAIVSVTVETSNNNLPVIVHASDWINLNVYGRVTYTVKNNN